ncbi:MAG TPA: ABC transporter permease [Trueperaceae bacterium]|nr:ABC transporter permease [Trueperaceae bacterium]
MAPCEGISATQPATGNQPSTSFELTIASLLVSIVFGVTMGVLAAVFRNTGLDTVARATALIGQAIPGFFLGIVAIIIFGAQLKWLPTGGRGTIQHLILPAIALGTYYAAITARFVRGSMLEVLHSDYVRTARAKGLRRATVIIRHSLRNALIGVVTLIGLQLGNLLGGAVVIETVFSWPGVGRLAVQAIYARDFPLVQVIIMIAALIFVVVNLITDLSYRLLDPRIRVGGDA